MHKEERTPMTTPTLTLCIALLTVSTAAMQQIPADIPSNKEVRTEGFELWRAERTIPDIGFLDLLSLVCDADDIPGYALLLPPAPPEGRNDIVRPGEYTHTRLQIGYRYGQVTREWFSLSALQAYHSGALQLLSRMRNEWVQVEVRVYPQPARQFGQTFTERQRSSSTRLRRGTPSGHWLGEENFYLPDNRGGGTVWFVYDRATVHVVASLSLRLAEAIAHSLLYRLLMHPKQVVMPVAVPRIAVEGRLLPQAGLTMLGNVVVAPTSVLRPFGVQAQVTRTSELWAVTLRRGDRWVQVEAFGWRARTSQGEIALERPVFPYSGDLVVPLRQVAEALGLTVQAQ
jgi:hypothetical protein